MNVHKIGKTELNRARAHANLHGNYATATINNGVITSPAELNGEQHSSRNLSFRASRKSILGVGDSPFDLARDDSRFAVADSILRSRKQSEDSLGYPMTRIIGPISQN